MENYKNQVSVIAKPSYYGGRHFIKYNTATKLYYIGNTASTAVSESAGVQINGTLMREIYSQMQERQYKRNKKMQRKATIIGSLEAIAFTLFLWLWAVVMLSL
jgi:hypothetical protein